MKQLLKQGMAVVYLMLLPVLLPVLLPGTGKAALPEGQLRINSFFQAFDANPKAVLQSLPRKYDKFGQLISKAKPIFLQKDIQSGRFVSLKNRLRTSKMRIPLNADHAAVDAKNNPAPLLLTSRLLAVGSKVGKLGLANPLLNKGQLAILPWSGDYWPIYRGILASRYSEKSYPKSELWKPYADYFQKVLMVPTASLPSLDKLSPAEKYDILVGNGKQLPLTHWSLNESAKSVEADGKIQTWMGICHGWAPAAYMTEMPKAVVSFNLPTGQVLNFYPDDIKALISLLWANVNVPSAFIGGRCSDLKPKIDEETGRIKSADCWDVNPASWHITVVNRLGIDKKSFVMDATWDYEVWNHPVQSYDITYFNPQTKKTSKNLLDVMIPIGQFSKDKFTKYRAPTTKYIVGVMMDAVYVVESTASHNTELKNETNSSEVIYDLEIDGNGKLVGGEWYQNAHPDFLWTPGLGAKPIPDIEVGANIRWDGIGLPDSQVAAMAAKASSRGMPLSSIVYKLLDRSTGSK